MIAVMTEPVMVGIAVAVLLGPFARPGGRAVVQPRRRHMTKATDPASPRRRSLRRIALTTVAVAVGVVIGGPLVALAAGVALIAWPSVRDLIASRAARRRIEAAIPDAIDMLILVIHAGMTPHQAVAMMGDRSPPPIRPALREVRRRVSRGASLAEALSALPEMLGSSAAVVADTLAMSERYGTPIAQALEQLSIDVRERRRRRAEAEARKLPIRMAFPLVCCTLPSFVLVAIVPAVLAAMSSLDTSGL